MDELYAYRTALGGQEQTIDVLVLTRTITPQAPRSRAHQVSYTITEEFSFYGCVQVELGPGAIEGADITR